LITTIALVCFVKTAACQPAAPVQTSSKRDGAKRYKCEEPSCQKVLFDIAVKDITANPNDGDAYFRIAQGMCPKINLVLIRRPLPDGQLACPEGTADALKKSLELAPNGMMAKAARQMLTLMNDSAISATAATSTADTTQSTHPPADTLDGVHVGYAFDGANLHVGHSFLVFSTDGFVLGELPDTGLDGAPMAAFVARQRQRDRSLVGQYRVLGPTAEIAWEDSRRQTITYDESGANTTGLHHYIPACRCTDAKFSGVYTWEKGSTLQFFPNGTFQDRGLMDLLILPNPYYEHPRFGVGSYEIRNNTLLLRYRDGHGFRGSFAATGADEGNGTFRWIAINQIVLNSLP
jgi:hypothetical protein